MVYELVISAFHTAADQQIFSPHISGSNGTWATVSWTEFVSAVDNCYTYLWCAPSSWVSASHIYGEMRNCLYIIHLTCAVVYFGIVIYYRCESSVPISQCSALCDFRILNIAAMTNLSNTVTLRCRCGLVQCKCITISSYSHIRCSRDPSTPPVSPLDLKHNEAYPKSLSVRSGICTFEHNEHKIPVDVYWYFLCVRISYFSRMKNMITSARKSSMGNCSFPSGYFLQCSQSFK